MTDEVTLRPATRNKVRLRDEPQPDPEVLARIEAVEGNGGVWRWAEEPEEVYLERLAAWKADPRRDIDDMPEPGDMVDLADRSGCDFEGMDLETLAELYLMLLPGFKHGYSHGETPTSATRALPGSEAKIREMQRRVHLHQRVDHPGDPFQHTAPRDS